MPCGVTFKINYIYVLLMIFVKNTFTLRNIFTIKKKKVYIIMFSLTNDVKFCTLTCIRRKEKML